MIDRTSIVTVRVWGADGTHNDRPWDEAVWHLVRDDHPYLDILTRGHPAQAGKDTKLFKLPDPCGEGMQWQRWDLDLSRERRLGEVVATLKVPKDGVLRCYVIPTALLSYRDVMVMAQDIEAELGFAAVWDMQTGRLERTWSRALAGSRSNTPSEILDLFEAELSSATLVRRNPFTELGPQSTLGVSLAENAIVSHWAVRRLTQVTNWAAAVSVALSSATMRSNLTHPAKRQTHIDEETNQLTIASRRLDQARAVLAHFVEPAELAIQIYPSPLFQRDHRLRTLMRAFAPTPSEALSETVSTRSHFPAVSLNRLWELWGVVWLAQELRRLGFTGQCSIDAIEAVKQCSWRLTKGDVVIEMDFEAEPTFIDYATMPAAHERDMPAMEWAARHQALNVERPFLGSELKCSPDYLVRITTQSQKVLLVGDACLATPGHHGTNEGGTNSKPYTVEKYRRTIGWATDGQVVRCHRMGGFVVFPPPADAWADLERVPGASDCTLLCPNPQGDTEARRRLRTLLKAVLPDCDISNVGDID